MRRSNSEAKGGKASSLNAELGRLLQRQRDEEQTRRLSEILRSSATVAKKIQQIKAMDGAGESEEGHLAGHGSPFRISLTMLKTALKKPLRSTSYSHYLLNHHRRIRRFGEGNAVMRRRWLPLTMSPDPRIAEFLRDQLQPDAAALLKICSRVMVYAWRYLSKERYNRIVVAQRLCYEILSTNFRVLNYRDRSLIHQLRNLETYFLALHYREEYLSDLADDLEGMIKKEAKPLEQADQARPLVARVMAPREQRASLHDFLLALNMTQSRRFLSLADIVDTDLAGIINVDEYACSPEIMEEIEQRVQDLLSRFEILKRQLAEIKRLKRTLRKRSGDEFDQLAAFYDAAAPKGTEYRWKKDTADIPKVFHRFLRALEDSMGPLLDGETMLKSIGRVSLFSSKVFSNSLHTLRRAANQGGIPDHNSLSRKRFESLRSGKADPTPAESRLISTIDAGIKEVLSIGETLNGFLESERRHLDKRAHGAPTEPIGSPGSDFYLPTDDNTIITQDFFNDQSVSHALHQCVAICYQAVSFFRERDTFKLLDQEARLGIEAEKIVAELRRLAPAVVSSRVSAEAQALAVQTTAKSYES